MNVLNAMLVVVVVVFSDAINFNQLSLRGLDGQWSAIAHWHISE